MRPLRRMTRFSRWRVLSALREFLIFMVLPVTFALCRAQQKCAHAGRQTWLLNTRTDVRLSTVAARLQPCHMAHLASFARLGLAIKMNDGVRLARQRLQIRDIIADQIDHLAIAVPICASQLKPADGTDM